ncbi:A-kinase anchor protein 10, mitochondrial isoform X3 [Leopardus geoffroyi]|uniref:A-kinase anchor protein 10, mitochondrial isoform X3 n=1 Tax=Leopardus geoffroyi TaxID=46844 RepID=UPI001E26166A|nr:A-kinase anchor protein 10, mitochondrial isoform X3 [Leopardus geoffroyi]
MRAAGPSPRQSPRALRPDPGPAMSFFRRKAKGKEQEKTSDGKSTKASISVHSPQKSTKNHALLEAAGPSHVAINAISANMDSFSSSRTATLKKQPSHMEAAHFGDLGIEQDAVNTFTKYISPDAAKPIPITEAMRNDIIAKICGEDGQVDPNCFVVAQSIVFSAMEQEHFSEFLRSHHFCKYQIEVLTSGTVYLADILFCESALFYFSEYMEKEDAVNILQFWLAADNFQSQLAAKKGQYDGQEAQNDAMILYDKYFSLQATHPLGFDDVVRLEIESNICREGGPLPNCFTTPLRQAWTTMEKVFLPGFLSSNLYYKYLNDLIHSVRGDEFLGGNVSLAAHGSVGPPDDSHPGGSDGSASQSSMKKASVKILKNFDEAIIVDAASLDPESLYQRTYAGKMTFGRVSDLGQFIRESEPEPDVKKSKGSMFSQAMKKWVQGNTDEAQEELAWKIAKMIVSDVMQQAQYDQPLERSTKL